jgi:predicted porin
VTEQDAWLGGVRYTMGFATVYAALEGSQTYGARAGTHTYELGMQIHTGHFGAILAEWSRTSDDLSKGQSWYRNTGALAYDYFLSKRTDVYAVCLYDKISNHGSATTAALAIRHRF